MNYRYKWKKGSSPTRDEAIQAGNLLDESQFDSEGDRKLAEEDARKHLGIPTTTNADDLSILPQASPPESLESV